MPKVHVSKSIHIKSPQDKVFSFVRDFSQWPVWSPWLITDPDCQLTYRDDGNQYTWDGPVTGAGEMEVLGDSPNEEIHYDLRFLKPFKSQAKVTFRFAAEKGGTKATWIMDSSLPFFLFFMRPMMTAMIGMDYQRGLSMLKDQLEDGKVPSTLAFPGESEVTAAPYIGIHRQCSIDEMPALMGKDFQELCHWAETNRDVEGGKAFSIYHQWTPTKNVVEYTTGLELAKPLDTTPDGFTIGERPACRAFVVTHTGPFRHLGNAWSAGMFRSRNKIFCQHKAIPPFEVYDNLHEDGPEEGYVTSVHFPVR